MKIKEREKQISLASNNKTEAYNEKWFITDKVLAVTLKKKAYCLVSLFCLYLIFTTMCNVFNSLLFTILLLVVLLDFHQITKSYFSLLFLKTSN